MRTLYLHIGMPKTGSTVIQHFCMDNVNELRHRNLCYPYRFLGKRKPDYHHHLTTALRRRFYLRTEPGDFPSFELCVARLKRELEDLPPDCNVLLSSESFSSFSIFPTALKILHKALSPLTDRIVVILYLRRQDELVISERAEQIKRSYLQPDLPTPDAVADSPLFSRGYDEVCDRWASVFGKENLVVRPYDRAKFPGGDVITDFLQILGIERDDKFKTPAKGNPSMPEKVLEFKCLVNRLYNPPVTRSVTFIPEKVYRLVKQEWPDAGGFISPAERLEMLQPLLAGNEGVARKYLGSDDGVLFTQSLPDPNAPFKRYEPLNAKEIRRVFDILNDVSSWRALWLLGRIRAGLRSEDPRVLETAQRMSHLLKSQRLPWLLPLFAKWGQHPLRLFKLPGLASFLHWALSAKSEEGK